MIHHPHYISQFAEDAQQAVWADGLDVPIAASILPSARVTPVDGGYRISGQFPFASGINHSRWVIVGGMDESGGHPEWTFFLIGPNDFKVVDTWFTGAMRATGSNTAICDDVFVRETHTIRLSDLREGKGPGGKLYAHPIYRAPFISYAPLATSRRCWTAGVGRVMRFSATGPKPGCNGTVIVAIAETTSIQVRLRTGFGQPRCSPNYRRSCAVDTVQTPSPPLRWLTAAAVIRRLRALSGTLRRCHRRPDRHERHRCFRRHPSDPACLARHPFCLDACEPQPRAEFCPFWPHRTRPAARLPSAILLKGEQFMDLHEEIGQLTAPLRHRVFCS